MFCIWFIPCIAEPPLSLAMLGEGGVLLELVQVQVLELEQGLLQVQQGHGQVQVILSLASWFLLFCFLFLTLKTH